MGQTGGGRSYDESDSRSVRVTVYEWEGVGLGASSFGHMSVSVDGISYSLSPNGLDIRPESEYLERNTFRGSKAMNLSLTPSQANHLAAELRGFEGKYNFLTVNCATLIQDTLSKVGYQIPFRPLPSQIGSRVRGLSATSGTVDSRRFVPGSLPMVP
jgi:hypothetical protein